MSLADRLQVDTERLTLRPPRIEDLDGWTAMMQDEETAKFIGGTAPRAVCWRQIMTIAPDNVASQRVALKLGSRNLGAGKLPPPFEAAEIDIWGQSLEEWRRRRRV
jgi:RimJ/RimL family protein N-acetyltransferase